MIKQQRPSAKQRQPIPLNLRRSSITLMLITLVLLAVPLSPVVPKGPVASTEAEYDRALIRIAEAGLYVRRMVDGELVCREATAEEAAMVKSRDPDYPVMPIRPIRFYHQQDGLKIVLRGTPQLDRFPEAREAFIRAAAAWEERVQTPITVVIDVDYGPTWFGQTYPSGVLGATDPQMIGRTGNYGEVRSRLIQRTPDTHEALIYGALPSGALTADIGSINSVMAPSPVFRALGLLPPVADPAGEKSQLGDPPAIGFNSNFRFDLDPNNGIERGRFDFNAIAIHEIGHALGFSSLTGYRELDRRFPLALSVWDLFRFRPGVTMASFTGAARILSAGGEHVFFVGGEEIPLSTGRPDGSGGDGNQASHWKDNTLIGRFIGVMDPTIAPGERETLTVNDWLALDFFGYHLRTTFNPTEELSTDDGTSEQAVSVNGALIVNRLTPTRYPARLQAVRLYWEAFAGLPNPSGSQVRLIVFTDPTGSGRPPNNPQRAVDQMVTIPSVTNAGAFVDYQINNGPTLTSGDFYVGFQAPSPAGGVAFAADSNGIQRRRAYFSVNNGASFQGPLVLVDGRGNQTPVNILIRAVVAR
ncbi:MAG: NF038122 family metalloprotease [Acidobacteriota bacterium]|nr:M10 family metallopeptidase domain-containing protein [Blastocatellia bacterium]MDW8240260.1 NF038122 family metalloprotease [Acidobacteriota bacterium]